MCTTHFAFGYSGCSKIKLNFTSGASQSRPLLFLACRAPFSIPHCPAGALLALPPSWPLVSCRLLPYISCASCTASSPLFQDLLLLCEPALGLHNSGMPRFLKFFVIFGSMSQHDSFLLIPILLSNHVVRNFNTLIQISHGLPTLPTYKADIKAAAASTVPRPTLKIIFRLLQPAPSSDLHVVFL